MYKPIIHALKNQQRRPIDEVEKRIMAAVVNEKKINIQKQLRQIQQGVHNVLLGRTKDGVTHHLLAYRVRRVVYAALRPPKINDGSGEPPAQTGVVHPDTEPPADEPWDGEGYDDIEEDARDLLPAGAKQLPYATTLLSRVLTIFFRIREPL